MLPDYFLIIQDIIQHIVIILLILLVGSSRAAIVKRTGIIMFIRSVIVSKIQTIRKPFQEREIYFGISVREIVIVPFVIIDIVGYKRTLFNVLEGVSNQLPVFVERHEQRRHSLKTVYRRFCAVLIHK